MKNEALDKAVESGDILSYTLEEDSNGNPFDLFDAGRSTITAVITMPSGLKITISGDESLVIEK